MKRAPLFGAIADDYTGAADLAGMLREEGVRTGVVLGLQPDEVVGDLARSCDAVVIALKSRSVPPARAREWSLRALEQLRRVGVRQVQFKYCSTFDSTREGNIGPVADALMDAMGVDFTVAVPALPVNGRTQYLGHLFVGDRLLADSHMRDHPVTPMRESNLVRHLQAQTGRRVGLVAHPVVRGGAGAIRGAMAEARGAGEGIALVDVTTDDDLRAVAAAVADLPLVTGGSGLGMMLPRVWRQAGWWGGPVAADEKLPGCAGGVLVLAGSCSAVTLEQLAALEAAGGAGLRVDVPRVVRGGWEAELARLEGELETRVAAGGWALVASSAPPEQRQESLAAARAAGVAEAGVGERVERLFGELARRAVARGVVANLVVAGGETTGAVTQSLGIQALEIGRALDPGVPVARSTGPARVGLVFKSGNFGSPDFFRKALRHFGVEIPPRLPGGGTAPAPAAAGIPGRDTVVRT